jgi:steroid delta-isomerase-like uncharacterized protein
MAAEFAQRKRLAYDERLEGEMAETNTSAETVTSEWVEGFRDRWWAAWNSHQPERMLELMTEDIVWDDAGWPRTMRGHAEAREYLEFMWRAFPDITFESQRPLIAVDGSGAAYPWRGRGTNTGPLDPPGMPGTGKTLEWEGADFHDEYRDGKVARLRIVFDMSDTWRQLGLLPDGDSAG